MNNVKHTSGPWRVHAEHGRARRLVMAGERCVAVVRPTHQERAGQGRANARLIAAAPELAAALDVALEFVAFCWRDVSLNEYAEEQRDEAERVIMAALAKARGED